MYNMYKKIHNPLRTHCQKRDEIDHGDKGNTEQHREKRGRKGGKVNSIFFCTLSAISAPLR